MINLGIDSIVRGATKEFWGVEATLPVEKFNNLFAHKVPKIYVTKQRSFEASKFFNLLPLSTVLIHGNGLFTAQLCLLTFFAAAFLLGKYEK